MIGFRHTVACLCGCHHVVGLTGVVAEAYGLADLAVVRFSVPSPAGGPERPLLVAYTLSEAGLVHGADAEALAHGEENER